MPLFTHLCNGLAVVPTSEGCERITWGNIGSVLKHAWHVGSAIKVLLIKSTSFVTYNVVSCADLELQELIGPLGLIESQFPHPTQEETGPGCSDPFPTSDSQ